MNFKGLFQSKTFWTAFIWFLMQATNYFGFDFQLDDAVAIVGLDWDQFVNSLFAVIMVVLRVVSNRPIKGLYQAKKVYVKNPPDSSERAAKS